MLGWSTEQKTGPPYIALGARHRRVHLCSLPGDEGRLPLRAIEAMRASDPLRLKVLETLRFIDGPIPPPFFSSSLFNSELSFIVPFCPFAGLSKLGQSVAIRNLDTNPTHSHFNTLKTDTKLPSRPSFVMHYIFYMHTRLK